MKAAKGYVLRNIQGLHYILPIGQNIALHKKGLQLNDTGVFLWNVLTQGANKEELLQHLIQHYQANTEDIPTLQSDLDAFLSELSALHLIYEEPDHSVCNRYFKIGTITIGYQGPNDLLFPSLLEFSCNCDFVDQYWVITSQPFDLFLDGERIIQTRELEIYKNEEYYTLTYTHPSQLTKVQISLDGTYAYFYCVPPYSDALVQELFHAFRFAFLIYAQTKGFFALHSASILYKNRAWLFAGSSGTGKSTHVLLWKDLYQTPILNGDLNLISIQNGQPLVWGIPWCGTSGIYTIKTHSLGGITLLKQHPEDEILPLNKSKQQLMVMQRLISPTWTENMFDYNLSFSKDLVNLLPIFRFLCRKDTSAAKTMKQQMDAVLD